MLISSRALMPIVVVVKLLSKLHKALLQICHHERNLEVICMLYIGKLSEDLMGPTISERSFKPTTI